MLHWQHKPAMRCFDCSGCLLQGMGYLMSHDICEFAAHATQHLLDTAPEVSTVNSAQVQGTGSALHMSWEVQFP